MRAGAARTSADVSSSGATLNLDVATNAASISRAGQPCYGLPPDATDVARHGSTSADHTSLRAGTNVALGRHAR
jgi:hypothetical protein